VEYYKTEVSVFKKERIINRQGAKAKYWVSEKQVTIHSAGA